MTRVLMHDQFKKWRKKLRDQRALAKIAQRIVRIQSGNMGDVKFFDGIGELRIDTGPGYRVYFMDHNGRLIILLCGGDKGTQARDIKTAKALAKEIREDGYETD